MKRFFVAIGAIVASIAIIGGLLNFLMPITNQPASVDASAPTQNTDLTELAPTVISTLVNQSLSVTTKSEDKNDVYLPLLVNAPENLAKQETPIPALEPLLTVSPATIHPSPTTTPTPEFTPTTIPAITDGPSPTDDPNAPTLDPKFFVSVPQLKVNVTAKTLKFKPILEYIVVQGGDFAKNAQVTGQVLEGNLDDVPEMEMLGPPCTPGKSSWLTGFNYGDKVDYGSHMGVDIACGDMKIAAWSRAKVYSVLWDDSINFKLGSSGMNVSTISKIPKGVDYHGQVMEGFIIAGNGHMDPSVPVQVGQIVEAGEVLGNIGMTGNTNGPHDHYYMIWLKLDGTFEFLNPNEWGAIGAR